MKKWQRAALATTLAVATAGGVTMANGVANARENNPSHGKPASVEANKRVVLAFMQDVLNGHNGDHAVRYLTPGMSWHSGTVGTVAGRDNVADLMTTVVTSIPDLHAEVKDIFGQGNKVVVRLVVSGTQTGPLLGVPASGRHVQWDAIDLYHLDNGKISEEWASEDYVAFLNDTGAYKAPWIA
ncbi:ester cyclase [Streptomyces sp. NPDC058256]|uniref:ester cyclase n=1 Tax=Streptomyces sp. NPDC058256 TaxID=3346408 RepID=UPI0036DFABC2